jgi:hypothetical protein
MKMAKVYKLVVYVPTAQAEQLRNAMAEAGAGRIGNYTHCTFSVAGWGRFLPTKGAAPAKGHVGELQVVEEERIETVCPSDRIEAVVAAIRRTHPYEEPAFDVYPIELVE